MQLCNARTRSGDACRRVGNVKNGRCHLHGGKSTGPRTDEGRQRIAKAHFKHGRRSKSYLQQRHDLKAELRSIEADLIKTGLLKKDWGQLFNFWGGHPLKWLSILETRILHLMGWQAQLSVFSHDPVNGPRGYFIPAAIYALPICILKPMMHRDWSVYLTH